MYKNRFPGLPEAIGTVSRPFWVNSGNIFVLTFVDHFWNQYPTILDHVGFISNNYGTKLISRKDKLLFSKEHLIFRKEKLIFRKEKLIFRKDELIFRKDKLISRKDKLIFRKDKLIFRKKHLYSGGRN